MGVAQNSGKNQKEVYVEEYILKDVNLNGRFVIMSWLIRDVFMDKSALPV